MNTNVMQLAARVFKDLWIPFINWLMSFSIPEIHSEMDIESSLSSTSGSSHNIYVVCHMQLHIIYLYCGVHIVLGHLDIIDHRCAGSAFLCFSLYCLIAYNSINIVLSRRPATSPPPIVPAAIYSKINMNMYTL